jgi:hypothetical protein
MNRQQQKRMAVMPSIREMSEPQDRDDAITVMRAKTQNIKRVSHLQPRINNSTDTSQLLQSYSIVDGRENYSLSHTSA